MVKILSQAGMSLADIYDIEGSIAGVEHLSSHEVQTVHEMGGTIAAERIGGFIARATTGAIAQSTAWNVLFTEFPPTPFRILGVSVMDNSGGTVSNCQISIKNNAVITAGREIPIFVWDTTADSEVPVRWVNNGAAVTEFRDLRQAVPSVGGLPSMGFGDTSRMQTPTLVFRGSTAAFGGGTAEVIAQVYGAWMELGGISSYGLPVPGW